MIKARLASFVYSEIQNWKEIVFPPVVYNYIAIDAFLKNETVIKSAGKKD